MKKLALLSVVAVSAFTLSSFTTVNRETKPLKPQGWKVTCADGSYGGSFICDCSQTQAQRIADLMCN
ncbi:hypothetical protein [Chryseobacterium lathyri]|uniref:hypothetical protein n=1 Tax=Chryseobacterium lathyri TaxID=395933 RepID=UPI0027823DE6|nr:hypothetical protein [Chryseobacterium lathyri]MDQ0067357.1 invasion protein IalB [Chryseobacterium lathyri]